MGWVSWKRKSTVNASNESSILGLDLNASRARGIGCGMSRPPRTIPLDDPHEELPLAVSLEKSTPEVGRAALSLVRKLPHLACLDYLNDLGSLREFKHGRYTISAAGLLDLVLRRIRAASPNPEHVTLTLPVHLTNAQAAILNQLLERAKLPCRGTVALPLALLAATDATHRRPPSALVVDLDDHALSASLVACEAHQVRMLGKSVQPRL